MAEPRLAAPEKGDYALLSTGNVPGSPCPAIPPFPEDDRPVSPPVPRGDPDNTVKQDYYGTPRAGRCVPGAIGGVPDGSLGTGTARPVTPRFTGQNTGTSPVTATPTPAASLPCSLCTAGCVIGGALLSVLLKGRW